MSGEAIFGHFEITRAKNAGQKDNPHGGQFDKWYVGLENLDGGEGQDDAYWQRKAPSEVKVGDKVYGKLEEGQYGWRFFLEPEPDNATRGGSGSSEVSSGSPSSDITYAYPPRPEVAARMGRAHAQEMAVTICSAMGTFEGNSAEQIYSKLLGWINWFSADVDQAGHKAANQAGGSPADPQAGAAPPTDASPSSGSQTPDEHQWFCKLLEAAHLNSDAAHTLASFVIEKFSQEQKTRAESGLEDFDSQMATLKKLEAAYEKSEGASLPSGAPEDSSIPF